LERASRRNVGRPTFRQDRQTAGARKAVLHDRSMWKGVPKSTGTPDGKALMTNDAKLGMLAGVLGVIVAAVLLTNAPPRNAQPQPGASIQPTLKEKPAPTAPVATPATSSGNSAALPSSPVARTRKDVNAQPTSLSSSGVDEEP